MSAASKKSITTIKTERKGRRIESVEDSDSESEVRPLASERIMGKLPTVTTLPEVQSPKSENGQSAIGVSD